MSAVTEFISAVQEFSIDDIDKEITAHEQSLSQLRLMRAAKAKAISSGRKQRKGKADKKEPVTT